MLGSLLRKIFQRGSRTHSSARQYQAAYTVSVTNPTTEQKTGFLVIPAPQNTDIQTLQSRPVFSPNQPTLTKDVVFGNIYGVWNLSLAPGETQTFTEEFSISVNPQTHECAKRFTAKDYQQLPKDLYDRYIAHNTSLNSDAENIKQLSREIVAGETDLCTNVKKINDYCVQKLTYGDPITGLYSSLDALTRPSVDCGGFDTLFVALCQAAGIPARIISGFWAGYEKSGMHAWAEALLPDGSLIPVDPSLENRRALGKTTRSGRFGFVGSDRITFSVGAQIPIVVNGQHETTDILQNPILFPVPLRNDLSLSVSFNTHEL